MKKYKYHKKGMSYEKCGRQNLEYFQISNQWKKYKYHKKGMSNEKCGGQKLEYFQISNPWKKFKYCGGQNIAFLLS